MGWSVLNALTFAYGRLATACKRAVVTIGLSGLLATAALADGPVISVFGDSLVAGYGLQIDDGLVPQLQRALQAEGISAELVNHGISGDTTAGGRARFDWTMSDDVDGLILSLGANDFLRGLPPEAAKENLQAMLEGAKTRGLPVLLIGFQSPSNWGPDYKTAFDAMYPDLSAAYETMLMPFYFAPIVDAENGTLKQSDFQPDLLHPNAAGVAKIVQSLLPYVSELVEAASAQ